MALSEYRGNEWGFFGLVFVVVGLFGWFLIFGFVLFF